MGACLFKGFAGKPFSDLEVTPFLSFFRIFSVLSIIGEPEG